MKTSRMVDLAELKMHLRDQSIRAQEKERVMNLWRQASIEEAMSNQPRAMALTPSGSGSNTPGYQTHNDMLSGSTSATSTTFPAPTGSSQDTTLADDLDDDTINSFTRANNPATNSLRNITRDLMELSTQTPPVAEAVTSTSTSFSLENLFDFSNDFWLERNEVNPVLNGFRVRLQMEEEFQDTLNGSAPTEESTEFELHSSVESLFAT